MKGYGHISIFAAPFIAAGLAISVARVEVTGISSYPRQPVTRPSRCRPRRNRDYACLVLAIPAAVLAGIGVVVPPGTGPRRWLRYELVAGPASCLMVACGFFMLGDALRSGPTWYDDYGLFGMQYGASQLDETVPGLLMDTPSPHVYITSTWTNGANFVIRFLFFR